MGQHSSCKNCHKTSLQIWIKEAEPPLDLNNFNVPNGFKTDRDADSRFGFSTDGNQAVVCGHQFDNPVLSFWHSTYAGHDNNFHKQMETSVWAVRLPQTKPAALCGAKTTARKTHHQREKSRLLTDISMSKFHKMWILMDFASKPPKTPPRSLRLHAVPPAAAVVELHGSVGLRHFARDVEATAWAKWTW